MAGPFHHDLRRDAAGEGEADERPAAGVGADERPFRAGLFYFLSGTEEYFRDGGVEATELAEVFEVIVHLLVGYHWQGKAVGIFPIVVLVEDGLGEAVEVYRQAVVGLLGSDVEAVAHYVAAFDLRHIRISERSERAEAEEVAGLGQCSGLLDGLLIFIAVHILQRNFRAVRGDFIVVESEEFFFRKEYDGLFEDLELGAVPVYLLLLAVAFADGPVQEPFKVVELLLDGLFLKVLPDAEEADELVYPLLVEVLVADVAVEGFEVVAEGLPALHRGVGPLVGDALLLYKLVEVIEKGLDFHITLSRGVFDLPQGEFHFLLELLRGRHLFHFVYVVGEMRQEVEYVLVDFGGGLSFRVHIFRLADSGSVPDFRQDAMANRGEESFLEDDDRHLYWAFPGLVRMGVEVEVYSCHIRVYFVVSPTVHEQIYEQYLIYQNKPR